MDIIFNSYHTCYNFRSAWKFSAPLSLSCLFPFQPFDNIAIHFLHEVGFPYFKKHIGVGIKLFTIFSVFSKLLQSWKYTYNQWIRSDFILWEIMFLNGCNMSRKFNSYLHNANVWYWITFFVEWRCDLWASGFGK